MELLVFFLEAIELFYAMAIWVIILGGLFCGLWMAKRGRWVLSALSFLIMSSPLALHTMRVAAAEASYDRQKEIIAALPRHKMPDDYPRTLLIEGSGSRQLVAAVLVAGYFDNVVMDQNGGRAMWSYAVYESPECQESAARFLDGSWQPQSLGSCVEETGNLPSLENGVVVLRIGSNRYLKGGGWLGGSVELSVRDSKGERRIAIDERPNVDRPKGMFTIMSETVDADADHPMPDHREMLLMALADHQVERFPIILAPRP